MWPQAGDEPQHRGLSASGWTKNRDELTLAGQIGHRKGDVPNHREIPEPLRHVSEFDDVRAI